MGRSGCRWWGLALGLGLGLARPDAALAAGGSRYTGQAIVTGTDMRDRPRGLALCLAQALVKASGDPNVLRRPGVPALEGKATAFVAGLSYVDRMSGQPKHDEQGSRDRPFTLTARFDPAKIDAALAGLGVAPWRGPRPTVALVIAVAGFGHAFTVTPTEPLAVDMRAALVEERRLYDVRVALPAAAGATPRGTILVRGTLRWDQAHFGWRARWASLWYGRTYRWGEDGVPFDDAFGAALAGALGLAAGHAPPRPGTPLVRR